MSKHLDEIKKRQNSAHHGYIEEEKAKSFEDRFGQGFIFFLAVAGIVLIIYLKNINKI